MALNLESLAYTSTCAYDYIATLILVSRSERAAKGNRDRGSADSRSSASEACVGRAYRNWPLNEDT